MDNLSGQDIISDLPQSILEIILTKLPIRDAVRTSTLSSRWRYKWATMTQLVFDDNCVTIIHDRIVTENRLVNFITRCLFLHDGPINKFTLSSVIMESSPDIDQWLLFLSRKDIKELVLEVGDDEWFRAPSCLFACLKLTRLELLRCELEPPLEFNGFPFLKYLSLQQVLVDPEVIKNLISGCPVLENLTLSYSDALALTVRAPNLKYLKLEGEFKDIYLEYTPLLVDIAISMYMSEDKTEHFGQSSDCNFDKFLGGVPCLEKLTGQIYFTKYLSIGNELGRVPLTYNCLKLIQLYQVSFEDMKEILVVLRLILSSPNLEELHISGSSNAVAASEASDLNFWETDCPTDCIFNKLKTVKVADISGVPHEMEFLKFMLRSSPELELMSIIPGIYVSNGKLNLAIELLRFRRASAKAEIIFIQDL